MMYNYQTSLQNKPPITAQMRLLDGLTASTVYPSTHADIMRAKRASSIADYNVNADRINADYDWAQQSAENAAISRGLQMMTQEKERDDSLRNTRISSLQGMAGSLLGGLFR